MDMKKKGTEPPWGLGHELESMLHVIPFLERLRPHLNFQEFQKVLRALGMGKNQRKAMPEKKALSVLDDACRKALKGETP